MFFRYNWPGIAWIVIILFMTGIPGNYIPEVTTLREWLGPDKITHLLMFGILSYLTIRGLKKQYRFPILRYNAVAVAIIFGIILGIITELMQKYIFTGRNANIYDFMANVLGSIAGWGLICIFNGNLKGKSKRV